MTAVAASPRSSRRSWRRFIPPQHGAWAMLLLPYLAGLAVTSWRWPHAPLLGAWITGYLLSYYVMQAVKTRRARRVRGQLIWYGALTAALAAPVVAARPAVLLYAPAYALLLAVNAGYAWRRRDRALGNDIAFVVQSCLMVFLVATVADVPVSAVGGAFVVVLAYLVGTVFYVKTMIRERDNIAFRRWSVRYHAVALVAAAASLDGRVAALFGALLVRAWVLPGRRLAPKYVGVIEILNSILVLVAVGLTWR